MGAAGRPRHTNSSQGSYIRPQSAPMGAPVHQENTWQPQNVPTATSMGTHGCCRTAQAPKHPQGILYPTPICTHGCCRAPRGPQLPPSDPTGRTMSTHGCSHRLIGHPRLPNTLRVPISDPNQHPWVLIVRPVGSEGGNGGPLGALQHPWVQIGVGYRNP